MVGIVSPMGTAMCSGGHSVQWAQRPWAKLGLTPMLSQWARLRADHHERRYDHPPQRYISEDTHVDNDDINRLKKGLRCASVVLGKP